MRKGMLTPTWKFEKTRWKKETKRRDSGLLIQDKLSPEKHISKTSGDTHQEVK